MRIQLTLFVSLLAIGLARAAITAGTVTYTELDSYSDDLSAYSTYGVYGPKPTTTGGNSACPNEPIKLTISGSTGWSLCCENEIKFYPIDTPAAPKCCLKTPYSSVDSICCGGIITKLTDVPFPGCCNNILYDRTKFTCCNNQLIKLPEGSMSVYECCGFESYVSTSAYGSTPYTTSNGAAMGRKKRAVVGSVTSGSYSYTPYSVLGFQPASYKDKLMDIKTSICCSGVIYPFTALVPTPTKVEDLALVTCCAQQLYRTDTHACCGLEVVARTAGKVESCCGGELFNPLEHLCCINKKQNITSDGGDEQKCCGTAAYNPKNQKCCAGYPVISAGGEYNYNVKCCGINTYDSTSHICCSGVPVKMIPDVPIANQRCCGLDVFDRTKWTCCNQESKVPKGKKCSYY